MTATAVTASRQQGAASRASEARGDANYWVDVRFVPTNAGTTPAPTPTPTPTTPPSGGWPGPGQHRRTGRHGTHALHRTVHDQLARHHLRASTRPAGADALIIHTTGVVIDKSLVPRVDSIYGDGSSSVTITDSDVRAGSGLDGALWGYNITARRVDVTGGQHSFHCNNNCELTDSWLHDQYNPDGGSYHNNAFISNGGHTWCCATTRCTARAILNSTDGGCTADVSLFGDFDPIDDVLVENNFLRANNSSISYCAYGGRRVEALRRDQHPLHQQRLRAWRQPQVRRLRPGDVVRAGAAGNVWSGNVWDSGEAVNP